MGALLLVIALRLALDPGNKPALAHAAWNLAFALTSQVFGALVLLWVVAPVLSMSTQEPLSSIEHTFSAHVDLGEASRRLRSALYESGLELNLEQKPYQMNTRNGASLADVQIVGASARSPFECWQTSWSGPLHLTPRLWATLAGSTTSTLTNVRLDLGLYPTYGPEVDAARALLAKVESALTRD